MKSFDKKDLLLNNINLFYDNDFKEAYVPDTQVPSAAPAVAYTLNVATTAQANTESIVCVLDNSIFNQGHYRHELVIMTTLPLSNTPH